MAEAMNYHKSQSVDAEEVEQASMGYQQVNHQESFLNDSNYLNTSFPNDSMNLMEDSFKSTASMNDSLGFPTGGEFDAVIKSEMPGDASSMPNRKPSSRAPRGVKIEHNDFSQAVQSEVENGNLSTTMDIPYEKTSKKMKELTGMFMKGNTCGVCD